MSNYSEQSAKTEVIQKGSSVTEVDNTPYVTTIDKNNLISSWLVVSSSKPKIDLEQVTKAIDVQISELKPNVPQTNNDFISIDQYNLLLSQSVELNSTVDFLRIQTEELSSRISELEGQTDEEISNRLSIQQTNTVLINQLTALSKTIDGFAQQISTALQKSVEESIFRTSLQAQNKGYEAQIQALITQADSLNAIITGLYAQLGAAIVQLDIENQAQSLAASAQGYNLESVVITKQIPGLSTPINNIKYEFYGEVNNKTGEFKWLVGGNLKFRNINKVPVEVTIDIYHPRYAEASSKFQKFFKLNPVKFTMSPESTTNVSNIFTIDGIIDEIKNQPFIIGQPKSKWYGGGNIVITINNPITQTKGVKQLNVALGVMHPKSF